MSGPDDVIKRAFQKLGDYSMRNVVFRRYAAQGDDVGMASSNADGDLLLKKAKIVVGFQVRIEHLYSHGTATPIAHFHF